MAYAYVKVNLKGLQRFRKVLAADLRGTDMGPVRAAITQWGEIYRAFLQGRFVTFSRGGGDWPGLKLSTLAARNRRGVSRVRAAYARGEKTEKQFKKALKAAKTKQGKENAKIRAAIFTGHLVEENGRIRRVNQGAFAGSFSVLRDTGLLFGALDETFANKPGQLQETVPFGVKVGFGGPAGHTGSRATIADIASFHQAGVGHLPKREIIVSPDDPTKLRMGEVMDEAIAKVIKDSGN